MTYAEKLKDPRWQKRRLEVLEAANWQCSECHSTERTLHVHHNFYRSKTEPWNYPDHALRVVCDECHDLIEKQRKEFKDLSEALFEDPEGAGFAVDCVIGFMKALRMFYALGTKPEHTEWLSGYSQEYGFARFFEGDQKDLQAELNSSMIVNGDVAENLWKLQAANLAERLKRYEEVGL
jgi:hypothetical protein